VLANLLLCNGYNFRREVSLDKMSISSSTRTRCLTQLQSLAYANSGEVYTSLYDSFKRSAPQQVMDYFDDNWHTIRHEWVQGLKKQQLNFLTSTNNRLESLNQKIKSVITRYCTLTQFFRDLLGCIATLRSERDHRAVDLVLKRAILPFSAGSIEAEYHNFLTPYAAVFVVKQLKRLQHLQIVQDDNGSSIVEDSRKIYATESECTCGFFKAMALPCRHIVKMREHVGSDMFCPELCAVRWRKDFYISRHRITQTVSTSLQHTSLRLQASSTARILSGAEKYKKAMEMARQLSSVISEAPMRLFTQRFDVLVQLLMAWKDCKEVTVSVSDGDADVEALHDMAEVYDIPAAPDGDGHGSDMAGELQDSSSCDAFVTGTCQSVVSGLAAGSSGNKGDARELHCTQDNAPADDHLSGTSGFVVEDADAGSSTSHLMVLFSACLIFQYLSIR